MNSTAKVLIPEKEWLIKNGNKKLGSISKVKKGYLVLCNGKSISFKNLSEIKDKIGIALFEEGIKQATKDNIEQISHNIYNYPCKSKPYDPVYDVQRKLPLYTKRLKSKSQHCAGYYIVKFRKGWVKSFCPKLITLERYPFQGPVKTEDELKILLRTANQKCNN
jgi:hypothetical protein